MNIWFDHDKAAVQIDALITMLCREVEKKGRGMDVTVDSTVGTDNAVIVIKIIPARVERRKKDRRRKAE